MNSPKIKIIFELTVPDQEGGNPRKFSISRALKAKWGQSEKEISSQILNEIKTYKGSFVGDMISCLSNIVRLESDLRTKESTRTQDVRKWSASVIENILFGGLKDGMHAPFLDDPALPEWDGSDRKIQKIDPEEIKKIDTEKLLLLLEPRIKHFLFLMSKDAKKENQ